ncbi:hypothetical protein Q9251_12215 [Alkalihalobacillus macyae]|uniref:hypothetical protein n=1 Tax=Guptibacillus hwajinpoensis TaxID=208199 RepID=UPI00273C7E00|nr:hypothetical protein [Alkalihalobacillus macyae]MDP4551651.1 hypothetical protein [Alkalihalobacillus macyae]
MKGQEKQNPMWGELQEFVQQVEREQKQAGEAKPYIEQIRSILSKNMAMTSNLKTD